MTNPGAGHPHATMQALSTDECYRLLATHEIGRIGVNAEHYPADPSGQLRPGRHAPW